MNKQIFPQTQAQAFPLVISFFSFCFAVYAATVVVENVPEYGNFVILGVLSLGAYLLEAFKIEVLTRLFSDKFNWVHKAVYTVIYILLMAGSIFSTGWGAVQVNERILKQNTTLPLIEIPTFTYAHEEALRDAEVKLAEVMSMRIGTVQRVQVVNDSTSHVVQSTNWQDVKNRKETIAMLSPFVEAKSAEKTKLYNEYLGKVEEIEAENAIITTQNEAKMERNTTIMNLISLAFDLVLIFGVYMRGTSVKVQGVSFETWSRDIKKLQETVRQKDEIIKTLNNQILGMEIIKVKDAEGAKVSSGMMSVEEATVALAEGIERIRKTTKKSDAMKKAVNAWDKRTTGRYPKYWTAVTEVVRVLSSESYTTGPERHTAAQTLLNDLDYNWNTFQTHKRAARLIVKALK